MKTYHGSCHCGAVTFTVEGEFTEGMVCNCSYCHKKGYILSFIPANQLSVLTGDEKLTTYLFNHKKIHHHFCAICGVQPFGQSEEMIAVNLRCLDGLDTDTLTLNKVDGKSF